MCKFLVPLFNTLILLSSFPTYSQIKPNRYTEEDNVKMSEREKILPMNNWNFFKENYEPNGTKTYIDTVVIDGSQYLLFSFGTQEAKNNSDYISFFSLLIEFRENEDFMEMATSNSLYSNITSRNHPNYIGQGVLKRDEYSIDFVATKALNYSNAIINNKLFDLSRGNLVFITEDVRYKFLLLDRQFDLGKEVSLDNVESEIRKIMSQVSEKAFK